MGRASVHFCCVDCGARDHAGGRRGSGLVSLVSCAQMSRRCCVRSRMRTGGCEGGVTCLASVWGACVAVKKRDGTFVTALILVAPTPLALSLADSPGAQWRCVQCVVPCQPDTRPRASPTRDVLMARKEGSHHARVQVRLVDDGVQLLLLAWSSTCRVTASGATVWSVSHRRSTSIVFQFSRR